MTIPEFIAKWRKAELKESSASHEHFIDLCHALNESTPGDDATGADFCFEKGAAKHGGGDGRADVWKRGRFVWEYKSKGKDLAAAYDQLLRYKDALGNPPLLVVCDLDRIEVHTNFNGTVPVVHQMSLENLAESRNIEILRAVFNNPEELRPGLTITAVTQDAARHFAEIAADMRQRGLDPAAVAHFLDRIVFCLFAEDTCYLPNRVFAHIVEKSSDAPARFSKMLSQLFEAMATGGDFGVDPIHHFNGNLFDDRTVLDLTADEIKRIAAAAELDWRAIDPSIFGTLFERGLDPSKRAQLGAHFTSREDIELVVDAVIMTVLRREWDDCRQTINNLLTTGKKISPSGAGGPPASKNMARPLTAAVMKKSAREAESVLRRFLDRLQHVKILDPACGSGNFLYVALRRLKDLEKEVILYGSDNGFGASLYLVGPLQLYGIEVNSYAHDLAQMTVWIGWLQWIRDNGVGFPADPILRSLSDNIRRMDAVVAENGEPDWPAVDFIVGNPPFLGANLMRRELEDAYVNQLRVLYEGRIPGQSDLCCYWFEKARAQIAAGKCKRAGLLATQGIRGGANREVLKRIKESGGIFWAESDRPWILNGASVHVSMVGFDGGTEATRTLDGETVGTINANLTASHDVTSVSKIRVNSTLSYQGPVRVGNFNVSYPVALRLLNSVNPHGKPTSDVLRPTLNGTDITKKRPRECWVIDFFKSSLEDACLYEQPFAIVEKVVHPSRKSSKREGRRTRWWQHGETGDAMREELRGKSRFLSMAQTAKRILFRWYDSAVYPEQTVILIARSEDIIFGILHSQIHKVWALSLGTQLREKESGFRYTPSTCFETFPFPPGVLDTSAPTPDAHAAIAAAAKELNELRESWLNPPEWTRVEVMQFLGTVGGPWDHYIDPATVTDRRAIKVGTVRYPRVIALDAECAVHLKKRTLTNLYNDGPAWLTACHAKLDAAVAAAYGWPADLTNEVILERLLVLNKKAARLADDEDRD